MKIGIVTYHRTLNYGAVMQSLATRFVLEEMGHEVYYVDYWPNYHKEMYALFPSEKFKNFSFFQKLKFLTYLCLFYNSKKKRIESFERFFNKHIYPYCRPINDSFDVVIYGSDQIWRKQPVLKTYNAFYFGKNEINAKSHVSYAASMGKLPDNDYDRAKVKELISHLDKISVRENELKELLNTLCFNKVSLSLDPTLLLTSDEWDRYLQTVPYKGEKYVLLYLLRENPFDMKEVLNFINSRGLKLIVLHGKVTTRETSTNITTAGPLEFLRLIKNAEYVFSASFHGLAFSIIYRKQFFASLVRNSGRAESLLKLLGIQERLLTPNSPFPHNVSQIDYNIIHKRMTSIKKESIQYLRDINP